ncbi:hypothetical protein [Spirosoma pomorum]
MRLIFLLVMSLGASAFGQSSFNDSTPSNSLARSVSLQLGTTGPRLFFYQEISKPKRLQVRIGGQYIAYQKPIRVKVSSESALTLEPDFMIGIAQAGLVWQPFRRNSFFLTAGAGYTWHPNLSVVMTAENQLDLDGLILTPEDVGRVALDLRWSSVVGYIGGGFGRIIPRKRFGVGVELGMYYLGKPKVNLTYEGFLETTTIDEQVPKLERNLRNYRYLPVLNLTLTYRLSRNP